MPVRQVPNSDRQYHLVTFDKNGNERRDDPDGVMSERVLDALRAGGITDVFVVSHGWKGDVPAAIEQYDLWTGAMASAAADVERMRARHPDYRPLIVGLHWPSEPWGEEELGGAGGGAFSASVGAAGESLAWSPDSLVELYADRLSDDATPSDDLRVQIRLVVDAARQQIAPAQLPPEVVDAYRRIDQLAGLGSGELGDAPANDRAPFEPQRAYRATKSPGAAFGGVGNFLGGLLAPLRQLSFWKMKKRAQTFGEGGAAQLLARMQDAAGPDTRFHVAGHSFGCIVVSAMLRGAGGATGGRPPVHSAALLQGALSLWSFASRIEMAGGDPGYFRPLVDQRRVRGPIVTTQSRFDKAVGFWYPKAAGVAGQVAYALGVGELPKFGAVGTFGVQGDGTNAAGLDMLPAHESYGFTGGRIYNLNADQYIRNGGGVSGAHSDIAHPEVAHAVWEAALAE
ncbi:MAG TPA: hypothetical protein VFJ74_10555 [Gemmatimonadaceae bacterium]|nr:hypothetical protein [Gemmatimonadaceae bacterium]